MDTSSKSEAAAARQRARILKRAAAAVASVIGVSAATIASADTTITPDSVNHWQHVIDCAKALLSAPAAHAQYCAPGHDVFVSGSTG